MGFISDAVDTVLNGGAGEPTKFEDVGPATAFTLEQITPGAGGKKRVVVLTARGLPYRPLRLTTTQRAEFTWLPGFTEATVTVLGASEAPTSVSGYWKDKFIGPDNVVEEAEELGGVFGALLPSALGPLASALTSADGPKPKVIKGPITINGIEANNVSEVCDEIDSIVREGQIIQVTWGRDKRQGLIVEFEKNWYNAHDVEWTMKFEWSSRGEPAQLPVVEAPAAPKAASIAKLVADLVKAAQDPKFSLTPPIISDINAAMAMISDAADGVVNLSNAMVDAVLSPVAAVQQAVALASGLIKTCQDFIELFENTHPADMNGGVKRPAGLTVSGTATGFIGGSAGGGSTVGGVSVAVVPGGGLGVGAGQGGYTKNPPTPEETKAQSKAEVAAAGFGTAAEPADRSFSERVQAQFYVKNVVKLTHAVRQAAVQFRSVLVDQIRHELLAVYTARDGDELRHVSRIFYGTMAHWQDIMIFNGLASSILERGQYVLIPKVPEGRGGTG